MRKACASRRLAVRGTVKDTFPSNPDTRREIRRARADCFTVTSIGGCPSLMVSAIYPALMFALANQNLPSHLHNRKADLAASGESL
ncbi:hypothetical protein KIN_03170 [Litoreibacter roseus]|uniref:Uncharacterized protein n=1 Tax=Litoreibacter roseus TaxID=2601869 RepID=A0A6N6JAH2_9RHOB|nr:hypothetical protein KIN_03170 [Litoreibacter roseus]